MRQLSYVANLGGGRRVSTAMIKRSLATIAAVAVAGLAAAGPAAAQQPQGFVVDGPFTLQQTNGIIAILIGFTPPIGSNKGS